MPGVSPVTVISKPGTVAVIQGAGQIQTVTVVGPHCVHTPSTPGDAPAISADPDNRATLGSDGGVYVPDDLVPDPLAYYILAKA